MYCREFPLEDTLVLWDALFANASQPDRAPPGPLNIHLLVLRRALRSAELGMESSLMSESRVCLSIPFSLFGAGSLFQQDIFWGVAIQVSKSTSEAIVKQPHAAVVVHNTGRQSGSMAQCRVGHSRAGQG